MECSECKEKVDFELVINTGTEPSRLAKKYGENKAYHLECFIRKIVKDEFKNSYILKTE